MFSITWGGTRWQVGVPFFALLATVLTVDRSGTAALCLLASLLHEAGHIVVLLLFGRFPREVTLGLCGIRLVPDERPLGYRQEAAMLLAGPLVNLLMGAVLLAAGARPVAIAAHGLLGLFNLLPIEALDGGRSLAVLLRLHFSENTAARVVRAVSVAVLLPLSTGGFYLCLSAGNVTLLLVCAYLVFRLFSHERI